MHVIGNRFLFHIGAIKSSQMPNTPAGRMRFYSTLVRLKEK